MHEIGEGIRHPIRTIKSGIENFRNWKQAKAEAHTKQAQAREARRREEFERDKKREGCVIRSLESALGVQATEEEWQMRIRDSKDKRGPDPWYEFIQYVRERHNSPLGESLRRYEMQFVNTGWEVREALEQQKIVLMSMKVIWPDGSGEIHMAHIEAGNRPGQIILKSDSFQDGVQLKSDDLKDDAFCPSLVLTAKSPKSVFPNSPK